jgi:hypothetical protein
MPPNDSPSVMIEGAKLIFRNFAGLAREFNSEGDRNFSVVLDPELAQKLKAVGWRVKQLKPREEGEEGDYHLKVTVNYKKGRPPRCVLVTSNNRTELGSEEVMLLDTADIKNADIIINGWWSDMAGGGYSAFLKTLFVTINEDELEQKYSEHQTPGGDTDADEG